VFVCTLFWMALQRHRMKRPGAVRTEKAFKINVPSAIARSAASCCACSAGCPAMIAWGGRCHAIMACCARLRSRCKGSARSEHGSVMWPGLRPFGNAQAITRCGEPMQLSIVGKNFSPKIAPNSALRAFDGLCDDEAVPLICPTCQVFAQSASLPATACYLAWGCFQYFWWGATAAWRREIRLEAAHSGEGLLVEFSDEQGRGYAVAPCPRADLFVLHDVPEAA
jgi:hypothetical protein